MRELLSDLDLFGVCCNVSSLVRGDPPGERGRLFFFFFRDAFFWGGVEALEGRRCLGGGGLGGKSGVDVALMWRARGVEICLGASGTPAMILNVKRVFRSVTTYLLYDTYISSIVLPPVALREQ